MTLPDDLTKRLRNTGHVFARSPYHDLLDEAADRIEQLETVIGRAVQELDAEHRPQWCKRGHPPGFTDEPVDGRDPVGCVYCWPEDGSWPCASRMIADDLRKLLP